MPWMMDFDTTPRPPARRWMTSTRVPRTDGNKPNTTAVTIVVAAVKNSARASALKTTGSGLFDGPRVYLASATGPLAGGESGSATDGCQQQALRERLPNEPHTAGAKRDPDANLARACRRSHQQQVGEVGTGNKEHEGDQACEGDQRRRKAASQSGEAAGERLDDELARRDRRTLSCVGHILRHLDQRDAIDRLESPCWSVNNSSG
jgi:hypothetical protein